MAKPTNSPFENLNVDKPVKVDFFNPVTKTVWDLLGDGVDAPTTREEIRTNLGVEGFPQSGSAAGYQIVDVFSNGEVTPAWRDRVQDWDGNAGHPIFYRGDIVKVGSGSTVNYYLLEAAISSNTALSSVATGLLVSLNTVGSPLDVVNISLVGNIFTVTRRNGTTIELQVSQTHYEFSGRDAAWGTDLDLYIPTTAGEIAYYQVANPTSTLHPLTALTGGAPVSAFVQTIRGSTEVIQTLTYRKGTTTYRFMRSGLNNVFQTGWSQAAPSSSGSGGGVPSTTGVNSGSGLIFANNTTQWAQRIVNHEQNNSPDNSANFVNYPKGTVVESIPATGNPSAWIAKNDRAGTELPGTSATNWLRIDYRSGGDFTASASEDLNTLIPPLDGVYFYAIMNPTNAPTGVTGLTFVTVYKSGSDLVQTITESGMFHSRGGRNAYTTDWVGNAISSSVASDDTLTGTGAANSPLRVAVPFTTAQAAEIAVNTNKIGIPTPSGVDDGSVVIHDGLEGTHWVPRIINHAANQAAGADRINYIKGIIVETGTGSNRQFWLAVTDRQGTETPGSVAVGWVLLSAAGSVQSSDDFTDATLSGNNLILTRRNATTVTLSLPSGGSVTSNATISGTGTSNDPLGVANPFTDTDETKLDGISSGATVGATATQAAAIATNTANNQIDFTAASISGSTLTLTRRNASNVTLTLPAGGGSSNAYDSASTSDLNALIPTTTGQYNYSVSNPTNGPTGIGSPVFVTVNRQGNDLVQVLYDVDSIYVRGGRGSYTTAWEDLSAASSGGLNPAQVLKVDAFEVKEQATPNRRVRISAGSYWYNGAVREYPAQDSPPFNTPTQSLPNRVDRLYIRADNGAVACLDGTATTGTAVPTSYDAALELVPLARITLSNSRSTITNADIADERVLVNSINRDNSPAVTANTTKLATIATGATRTEIADDLPDPANFADGDVFICDSAIVNVTFGSNTYNFDSGAVLEKFGGTANPHWSNTGHSVRLFFRGAWVNTGGYSVGSYVTHSNTLWFARVNIGSNVEPNLTNTNWLQVGGGATPALSTDTQFETGTSTTLAPQVAQVTRATEAVSQLLSSWDGSSNPATSVQVGPIPTVTAGAINTNPYDAISDRFIVSSATGGNSGLAYQARLEWSNSLIDWKRTAFCYDTEQEAGNWQLITYFGATTSPNNINQNASGGGFGVGIFRVTNPADTYLFALTPYIGSGGSGGEITPSAFFNGAVTNAIPGDLANFNGFNITETNPRMGVMIVRNERVISFYVNRLLRAEFTLTPAQNSRATGSRYGFFGDGGNAKRVYLYGLSVGNPALSLLDRNCLPLEGATPAQATAIAANTAKRTYPSADETKVAGIATGATVGASAAQVEGFIRGFSYAPPSGTIASLVIQPGACRDSTNTRDIVLSTAITKTIGTTFAAGNNNGGRIGSSSTGRTWWKIYVIVTAQGVADVAYTPVGTTLVLPTGFVASRRIGFIEVNVNSSNAYTIEASYVVYPLDGGGLRFERDFYQLDATLSASQTAALQVVGVPLGYEVDAILSISTDSSTRYFRLESPLTLQPTITVGASSFNARGSTAGIIVRTNTSGQVYTNADITNTTTYRIRTKGFIDRRQD